MRTAFLLGLGVLFAGSATAYAADSAPTPGKAVDYGPLAFFPERGKEQAQSTMLFPWAGKQVVLLTTKKDLDPKVIAVFLDRLDKGWKYYADVVGQSPRPGKLMNKKVTIAAVPDVRLTCGQGCGQIGATGIEVAGFHSGGYPPLAETPHGCPPHPIFRSGATQLRLRVPRSAL